MNVVPLWLPFVYAHTTGFSYYFCASNAAQKLADNDLRYLRGINPYVVPSLAPRYSPEPEVAAQDGHELPPHSGVKGASAKHVETSERHPRRVNIFVSRIDFAQAIIDPAPPNNTNNNKPSPPTPPTPTHSKAWICLSNFLTIQLQFFSAFCLRCLLALAVMRPSLPLATLCSRIAASLSEEGWNAPCSHSKTLWF